MDLASNQLCGLDGWGRGTYTAEGIKAIADALRVNAELTKISLGQNDLGDDSAIAIASALKQSKVSKLAELDLNGYRSNKKIGPAGAKELAAYLAVTAELTTVWTPAHEPMP